MNFVDPDRLQPDLGKPLDAGRVRKADRMAGLMQMACQGFLISAGGSQAGTNMADSLLGKLSVQVCKNLRGY